VIDQDTGLLTLLGHWLLPQCSVGLLNRGLTVMEQIEGNDRQQNGSALGVAMKVWKLRIMQSWCSGFLGSQRRVLHGMLQQMAIGSGASVVADRELQSSERDRVSHPLPSQAHEIHVSWPQHLQ
jgi:hypothetical protein